MDFHELNKKLTDYLRERVHSGELTERGIARITGVSQPHIHNALKGKRLLSPDKADCVMRQLRLDLLDLINPEDIAQWRRRQ